MNSNLALIGLLILFAGNGTLTATQIFLLLALMSTSQCNACNGDSRLNGGTNALNQTV